MKPIAYWLTDPTIAKLCQLYGANFELLTFGQRLNLISGLSQQAWPPGARMDDAYSVWQALSYLDWPARVGLIQGICEAL